MSPRFGQLAATEVWAALTRTLTALTGTPRSDLVGSDAALWAHATRTLSALTGQPRTDLVGSDAALWSHATRALTDLSLEDIADLPDFYAFYSLITQALSAASGNDFGSWVQLVADVGTGKRVCFLVITVNHDTTAVFEVQLGVGAAGAEATATRVFAYNIVSSAAGHHNVYIFPVFLSLADNVRLSMRVRDDNASALGYLVSVQMA